MTLVQFQNIYCKILVDKDFRERFLADPSSALQGLSLDASSYQALCALPKKQVTQYAKGLLNKRWHEVKACFPQTLKVSTELKEQYIAWLATHPSPLKDSSLPPGQQEALRALPILRKHLQRPGETPYAAALLTYEVLASASRKDGVVRHLKSRFRLDTILEALKIQVIPFDLPVEYTLFRFEKDRVQRKQLTKESFIRPLKRTPQPQQVLRRHTK